MKNLVLFLMAFSVHLAVCGQKKPPPGVLRFHLNDSGTRYIQAVFSNQTWIRWNENNPGSMRNGQSVLNSFDIGLRRTRFQLFGEVAERTFLYFQMGQNNFNAVYNSAGNRKMAFFIHDAYSEYRLSSRNQLKVGAGLTIFSGLSRFSQPSVSNALTMDIPVFAQTTVDQTDQFSRNLSIFARGQIGKLDYRLILSDPFVITSNGQPTPAISAASQFYPGAHTLMTQGLFIYQFLDHENHTLPFMQGTYMGTRKIFNIAAGFITQPRAMWRLEKTGDTLYPGMKHWAIESFLDLPVSRWKKAGLTAYVGYFNTNYGPDYLRFVGIMNPATSSRLTSANGLTGHGPLHGNSFPMMGTGHSIHTQFGLLLPQRDPKQLTRLLPYVMATFSSFERLRGLRSAVYHSGLNILLNGQKSKITMDVQNRPVFSRMDSKITRDGRKNQVTLQFQVII